MYIYQNGKLYRLLGENKLVGVDFYSDKVLEINGTECGLDKSFEFLTKNEVQRRFHIEDEPYKFPVETKKTEVVKDEPIGEAKVTRGRPRK